MRLKVAARWLTRCGVHKGAIRARPAPHGQEGSRPSAGLDRPGRGPHRFSGCGCGCCAARPQIHIRSGSGRTAGLSRTVKRAPHRHALRRCAQRGRPQGRAGRATAASSPPTWCPSPGPRPRSATRGGKETARLRRGCCAGRSHRPARRASGPATRKWSPDAWTASSPATAQRMAINGALRAGLAGPPRSRLGTHAGFIANLWDSLTLCE
jgi:hypothetical protein